VEKGMLTVYNDLKSGNWVHVFDAALQAFNGLKLGVTMKEAADQDSANVVMQITSGPTTFTYGGTSYPGPTLDPSYIHGRTRLFSGEGGVEKAAVFLPNAPKTGPESEDVSVDMMKVIAVHELVHACGLEDGDHATDGGVFYFPLAPDGKGKMIVPQKGQNKRPMPPVWPSQSTRAKLAALWRKK
jgi:hypothetical protein